MRLRSTVPGTFVYLGANSRDGGRANELSQIGRDNRFLLHVEACRQTCPVLEWLFRMPLSRDLPDTISILTSHCAYLAEQVSVVHDRRGNQV